MESPTAFKSGSNEMPSKMENTNEKAEFKPQSVDELDTHLEQMRVRFIREHVKDCLQREVCPVCSKSAKESTSGFCNEEHYREMYHRISPTLPSYQDFQAEIAFEHKQL